MRLRIPDCVPDAKEPFKDDLLERARLAERLISFLANVEGPFTMALTGPYGSGKTHFLRRCQVLLEQAKVPTVLINAWETDFASEPLAPIISELANKFSGKLPAKNQRWKKAKSLAAKVAAASVPIGLKLVTAGILKAEDFSEGGFLGDAVEKIAEKQFEHFAAAKKSVEGLKVELALLTAQIRDTRKGTDGQEACAPVVVLIDELDRCRPTYSIDVLEVVKHFFEIPGIVFLLAIDRLQLISAAKAVFGSDLDGDGYLRRFIDFECSLPQPNIQMFCANVMQSQHAMFRWDAHQNLQAPLARLCAGAGFSLRRSQQFLNRAVIAIASASTLAQPEDAVLLVFLRELDVTLYNNFLCEKATSWQVLERLRELDPEFGYPDYAGGVVFLELLATLGADKKPKSFLELLKEDYQEKGRNIDRLDRLSQNKSSSSWRSYVRRIADCVDFCATIIS
jgi:hypothetical protein